MNPKPQLHLHQSRKNPAEIWQQSQADAEQIPECRELLAEIEGVAELVRQRQSRPRLFGQIFHGDKWSPAGVALSTVTVAEGPFRP